MLTNMGTYSCVQPFFLQATGPFNLTYYKNKQIILNLARYIKLKYAVQKFSYKMHVVNYLLLNI